jgi:hypothetical protein
MTRSGFFITYEAWARRVRYPASVVAIALALILDAPDPLGGALSVAFLALLFWVPGLLMLIRNFTIGYRGEDTGRAPTGHTHEGGAARTFTGRR